MSSEGKQPAKDSSKRPLNNDDDDPADKPQHQPRPSTNDDVIDLRGRVPEGLLAYQSMCVKVGGERNEELEKLLNKAAAKDVPRVQVGLSVKEGGGGKGIVRGGGVVLASLVPEGGGRVRVEV